MQLHQTLHPDPHAVHRFESLVGIDDHKRTLLLLLKLILDKERLMGWVADNHNGDLPLVGLVLDQAPLILLSGDVGCGKTELATSVASPLGRDLKQRVVCFETPSDIRGFGHVGELSARLTQAFTQAKDGLGDSKCGILVIDEADDLATSRSQLQAHHEDRAGVNVLIKQIDILAREGAPLAVILITNRPDSLDPAVLRRAALHLHFERPDDGQRRVLFQRILGDSVAPADLEMLVLESASDPPYTYSDLVQRVGRMALLSAIEQEVPLDAQGYSAAMRRVPPSPLIDDLKRPTRRSK